MNDWGKVKKKYCDICKHENHCYTPCPLVYAALWQLPCVAEIERICNYTTRKE